MGQRTASAVAFFAVIILSASADAQITRYVDIANCPGPGTGTEADPFCKIQDGIDAAFDGDTVLIADGTYTGIGNKNLRFNGKAITVQSENGPENCIIDCETNGRGFRFTKGETLSSILDGVTIQNGNVPGGFRGSGILCTNSSPTIRNCIMTANSSTAVYFENSGATITASTISNSGVAIRCTANSSLLITNCAISDNSNGMIIETDNTMIEACTITDNSGRGMQCTNGGSPTIIASTIARNGGEGILCSSGCNATIAGCTITDNGEAGIICDTASPLITNCLIAGNLGRGVNGTSSSSQIIDSAIWDNWDGGVRFSPNGAPQLLNCDIWGNWTAGSGGGVLSISDVVLTIRRCTIEANESNQGGGISYVGTSTNTVKIINSTISSNLAWTDGGGIHSGNHKLAIVGCTITKNTALDGGGGVYYQTVEEQTIANSILWGDLAPLGPEITVANTPLSVSYSDVQGGESQVRVEAGSPPVWSNNIDSDPLFVSPQNGDYHLPSFSPCIDAGDPNFIPEPDEIDIDGEPRVFNDLVDMGSDEYHDCDDSGTADYIEIAEGTSPDCNGNAVPDECDIADGADDCDENGVPDECQPDTDGDGTIDACDEDDDNDGVPDEIDPESSDPDICGDSDKDACDDCSIGTDDFGPLPDNDPNNDGPDSDGDGVCDSGDPCPIDNPNDSDGDGVCDSDDFCVGDDATGDNDGDGICDNVDICEGDDASGDVDADGICGDIDNCELFNPDQADCQPNDIGDVCDIEGGESSDDNENGVPDECECPADFDGSSDVGASDLAVLLGSWGPCVGCPADLDGDGDVDAADLAVLLGNWGPCE